MHGALILIGILGTLAIGVMSPGPSFVLVARTSIALTRRDGLAAALGMGVGSVVLASLALVGLRALLAQLPWLYLGLKLAGGAYLLYLAVNLWRSARAPLAISESPDRGALAARLSFARGLATQLSNPKTAIFYGSVFLALMPAAPPLGLIAVLIPLVFLMESGWYMLVALVFSSGPPRAAYLRARAWIDRSAAVIIGGLGLGLILDSARP